MNTDELLDLVAKMRAAQKRYFQTRDSEDMYASKALERTVDRRLEEWREKQGKLFEGDSK